MLYKNVQKEIKQKTDLILSNYKGKIETGGNIYHSMKTEFGKNVVHQSILNYSIYPVSCTIMISNDILSYNFAICSNWFNESNLSNILINLESIKFESDNNDNFGRFEILNKEDIDIWMNHLQTILEGKLESIFAKYNNLLNLENFLNYNFLHLKECDVSGIQIFLGLISSKILSKPYFHQLYDTLNETFIKNGANFDGSVQYELLKNTYNYLNKSSLEQLTNIEYLKSQIKN